MQMLNPNKTGLVFGTFLGACHAFWAALVAVGWAQAIMDFVFWMHMIKPVYVIGPFNFGTAVVLIMVTAAIGYVGGFVLAVVWNSLHREPRTVTAQATGRLTPVAR